jgi:hypothetical protein
LILYVEELCEIDYFTRILFFHPFVKKREVGVEEGRVRLGSFFVVTHSFWEGGRSFLEGFVCW